MLFPGKCPQREDGDEAWLDRSLSAAARRERQRVWQRRYRAGQREAARLR